MGNDDVPPGLRQRKKDQLRGQIIDQAIRLFIERGYDATTIEDIAGHLNISSRTFFRYFDSKEDVVVAGPFQIGARLGEFANESRFEEALLEVARGAVRRLAEHRQSLPDGLRHATLIVETPVLAARLALERERWAIQLAGSLASRIDPEDAALHARMIASSAVGALAAAFDRWVAERGARPLPEILERAFAFIDAAHDDGRGRNAAGVTPTAARA